MKSEHNDKRIYYTMGEVAEMLDVNQATLRFWESEFDVLRPARNKKGNRLFTPDDMDKVKLIYHLLKEQGLKIAVAKKRIKEEVKSHRDDIALVDRLMYIRAQLEQINQELKDGGLADIDDVESVEIAMPARPSKALRPTKVSKPAESCVEQVEPYAGLAKISVPDEPQTDFEVIEEELLLENSADGAEESKALFVEQTIF
jgi:DNA-binding transcriptional MerR regulator